MDLVSWIFFGPAKLVAAWQYAGILFAVVLIGLQVWLSARRSVRFDHNFFREAPVFAGLLWVIFNLYELQVAATPNQNPGSGTLRMDLIILVPILYVLTVAALVSICAQLRSKRADKQEPTAK